MWGGGWRKTCGGVVVVVAVAGWWGAEEGLDVGLEGGRSGVGGQI